MESFVYLALSIAVFLQFIPPQLCKEIKGIEIVHKDKDGLVDSTIDINFITDNRLEAVADGVGYLPTNLSLPQNRIEIPNMTCVEKLCENVPNYPLDEITKAVKNLPMNVSNTVLGDASMMRIKNRQGISQGIGLCEPILRIVQPQMATNTENKEKYIVNIPGLEQILIVTTCGNKVEKCGKTIIPPGIVARCRQRYSLIRLLSFELDSGAEGFVPKYDNFPFPSCCVCTLLKPPQP